MSPIIPLISVALILCQLHHGYCQQRKDPEAGILMTGGWNGVNQFYNPFEKSSPRVVDYGLVPMWGPSSAPHRSRVYIIGGRDNDGVSDKVQIYDPSLDKAFTGKSMNVARRWHSAVNLRSQIYVCGGTGTDGQALASCESFDPSDHEWRNVTDMPGGGRYAHSAVSMDRISGWNGKDFLSSVIEYDAFADTWNTKRAHLLQPRMASAAVEYHGHIVVCGGWNRIGRMHTCELYSPFMDKLVESNYRWSFGPVMMEARSSHGMVVFQDEMFLIAGEDDEYHMLDTIEHYDLRKNTSRLLKQRLVQPMRDFTSVVVGVYSR